MPLQLYKIGSVEVGSAGASTIDFTSIPQGYTDLMLTISARDSQPTGSWGDLALKINNSASSLTARYVYGTGSATASASGTSIDVHGTTANNTANTFGNVSLYIPNYASTTTYKSISWDDVAENNATAALAFLGAGLWSSNSAINQITIYSPAAYTISQYSTATLYGIL